MASKSKTNYMTCTLKGLILLGIYLGYNITKYNSRAMPYLLLLRWKITLKTQEKTSTVRVFPAQLFVNQGGAHVVL